MYMPITHKYSRQTIKIYFFETLQILLRIVNNYVIQLEFQSDRRNPRDLPFKNRNWPITRNIELVFLFFFSFLFVLLDRKRNFIDEETLSLLPVEGFLRSINLRRVNRSHFAP